MSQGPPVNETPPATPSQGPTNPTTPASPPDVIELYFMGSNGSSANPGFTTHASPRPGETLGDFVDRAIATTNVRLPEGTRPAIFSERGSTDLPPGTQLAALYSSGDIHPNDTLAVGWRHTQGAQPEPALQPDALRSRLFKDARFARELDEDPQAPVRITAHRTLEDAREGVRPVDFDHAPNPPRAYRATFAVPTLNARDSMQPRTTIAFDLLAGNWPYAPPDGWVVGPMPWNPHVRPTDGFVCTHVDFDHSKGGTFLADLICSVGCMLNYQEPRPDDGAPFFNLEALRHWRARGFQPLSGWLSWPDPILAAGLRGPKSR